MSQTPGQAAAALGNLSLTETLTTSLAAAAARIADGVRANLDAVPGGPHATPWRQTGALQASIEHMLDGLTAQIGSDDPAAGPQEYGTATVSPRPFFGTAVAAFSQPMADEIGAAVAAALARVLT